MRRELLLAAVALAVSACGGGSKNSPDGGGTTDAGGTQDAGGADASQNGSCDVPNATAASIVPGNSLYITAQSPDGQWTVGFGLLGFDGTSTFTATPLSTGDTFRIVSVGSVCGLSHVDSIPTTGWGTSATAQPGVGYVGQFPDGTFIRFFETDAATANGVTSANIVYEYPFTAACPTNFQVVFGYPNIFLLNGVAQKGPAGMSTAAGIAYPFVGCANGTAQVEVWGGGGSGADVCIAFSGGSGGGGGGGGGEGKASVALVAGQFYVVEAGVSGSPVGSGYSSCPTQAFAGGPGGTSSFGIEDAGALLSASGGQGGTGGAAAGGTGGMGGVSSASPNAAGSPGASGVSNNGQTLCGGAGSIGPGGGGGTAGNGGGGGTGGCTPGTPGIPGGGGAGGSQNGSPTNGAGGQVTIGW